MEPFPYEDQARAVAHVYSIAAGRFVATNSPPAAQFWTYRLVPYCLQEDTEEGSCQEGQSCEAIPGQLNLKYYIWHQRVGQPPEAVYDEAAYTEAGPPDATPPGVAAGEPYGDMTEFGQGCINVSELDLPPQPEEVAQVFTTLTMPAMNLSYQPPDLGLVNLPEIFYTTDPTTAQFVVDIRGYTVTIDAEVSEFHWYTGDPGTPMYAGDDPGAPYPNETVTHTYPARGTYQAALEGVWSAVYSFDGEGPYDVPATVTSTGPTVEIQIAEASPVLVDPND